MTLEELNTATILGKLKEYDRMNDAINDVLNQILPDNDGFVEEDADNWERVLGIDNSLLTIEERKGIILNRLTYPNNNPYRLTEENIQEQLRADGFDVYVRENRSWNGSTHVADTFKSSIYGQTEGFTATSYVINYIDETIDNTLGDYDESLSVYFIKIGGSADGVSADVPLSRKNEFRQRILQLKPAHYVAALQVNYV
jgi:uncharacterized protein YmfQ (DUF2313 family)